MLWIDMTINIPNVAWRLMNLKQKKIKKMNVD